MGSHIVNGINCLTSRDGYASWKFKMRMYLIHEDLWHTIIGYPDTDVSTTEVRKNKDLKALSKICLALDGPAITHVRNASTAKEAWNALASAYEDKSMGRKLALERRLYRYQLSDFKNIEAYIDAVVSTSQDLADIGKVIEDTSLAAILLGGLTPKYEPLIMALEHGNVEVTMELVKTKLLSEMSKEDAQSSVNDTAALRISYSKPKSKKKIICCN